MKSLLLLVAVGAFLCGCSVQAEESCEAHCAASYPLHTYPKPVYHAACSRGCRFALLARYTAAGCNETCEEAYDSDKQGMFACFVGCGVDVSPSVVMDHVTDQWLLNGIIDALFFVRVMDAVVENGAQSADASDDTDRWGVVDTFVVTDYDTANSSVGIDGIGSWAYSVFWSVQVPDTPSIIDESHDAEKNSDSVYYLVYYDRWSRNQFGVISQLLCYISLFFLVVAFLKCCFIITNGSDNGGLSIDSNDCYDDESDDNEANELPKKQQQQQQLVNSLRYQVVRKPDQNGHVFLPRILPIQNTPLDTKVEGVLTIV